MRDFSRIYKEDLDIVGKKAVELAELARLGIPIPDGFVITTSFFEKFLQQTGIAKEILKIQKIRHPAIKDSAIKLLRPIQKEIMHAPIPQNLIIELLKFYRKLAGILRESSLNIFSSSLGYKSVMFKNVKGDANLILKIKEIWASHIDKPIAIVVQKNINPTTKNTIITNNPPKEFEHIAHKIQEYFYFPQEVDYIKERGKIYITFVRPFTGEVVKSNKVTLQHKKRQNLLIKGVSINPGIATGPVKIFTKNSHVQIKSEEIIIVPELNKSLYGKIRKAKAIVADKVLKTPYDKMQYRKQVRVPTIINTANATKILQNGNIITVNGVNGEIYSGGLI